jgi:hypothetical protein
VHIEEWYQKNGKKGHGDRSSQINRDQANNDKRQNIFTNPAEFWCSFFKMPKDNVSNCVNDTHNGYFKP